MLGARDIRGAEAARHPFLTWAMRHHAASDDDKVQRRRQASYYGLISEVDEHLGRLFATLRANGQWDETLIIFTSDHGEQMGDHHLRGKLSFFDQSLHTLSSCAIPACPPTRIVARPWPSSRRRWTSCRRF